MLLGLKNLLKGPLWSEKHLQSMCVSALTLLNRNSAKVLTHLLLRFNFDENCLFKHFPKEAQNKSFVQKTISRTNQVGKLRLVCKMEYSKCHISRAL